MSEFEHLSRRQIRERIEAGQVPDSHDARTRTVALAQAAVSPAAPDRSRVPRLRIAGAVALALAIFAAATPAGRAASEWVGEMIGLDDVGGSGADTVAPQVLHEGTSPSGSAFQIRVGLDGASKSCVTFVWSEVPIAERKALGPTVGRCGWGHSFDDPINTDSVFEQPGGRDTAGTAFTGLVDPGVEHIEVVHHGADGGGPAEQAPVHVFDIPASPGSALGADDDEPAVGYWVAFLPPGVGDVSNQSEAEALAYAPDGTVLGRAEVGFVEVYMPRGFGPEEPILSTCGGGHASPFGAQCEDAAVGTPLLPADLAATLSAEGVAVAAGTDADRAMATVDRGAAVRTVLADQGRGKLGQYGIYVGSLVEGGDALPVYVLQLRVANEGVGRGHDGVFTPLGKPPVGFEPSDGFLYDEYVLVDAVSGEAVGESSVIPTDPGG